MGAMKDIRRRLTTMTKIMDIKNKCKSIMNNILTFKITDSIEKKRNKPKTTISF